MFIYLKLLEILWKKNNNYLIVKIIKNIYFFFYILKLKLKLVYIILFEK